MDIRENHQALASYKLHSGNSRDTNNKDAVSDYILYKKIERLIKEKEVDILSTKDILYKVDKLNTSRLKIAYKTLLNEGEEAFVEYLYPTK